MTSRDETTDALDDIQDRILDRLHAGEPLDREAIMARHPGHAQALRRFFDLLDVLETAPPAVQGQPTRLGDFEIVREIGRGGMGVVYEARQLSLKRPVALKLLPPALRDDPARLLRFRREAESAGRLRHPNIVPVYSIGELQHAPFFAMELVEGRSLAQILAARREGDLAGLPAAGEGWRRWCVDVCATIASALSYAHDRGILHRDVKPGNILIDSDGAPRLTDFGLALDLASSALTLSGEVFGSPRYMSPEQARVRNNPIDGRTDVYSLAVTLYELLTLRLPYSGNTSADILASLTNGSAVPPRAVDPECPVELEAVLLRGLQRDPELRYASAADLAADLRALLAGQLVPAATPGPRPSTAVGTPRSRRSRMPAWRKRLYATAVLLTLAVALAILGHQLQSTNATLASLPPRAVGEAAYNMNALSPEQLSELADGDAPEAQALLSSWLLPSFQIRSVLSRSDAGTARFELRYTTPADLDDDLLLEITPSLSVDGGDWRAAPGQRTTDSLPTAAATGMTRSYRVDLATLLGEALSGERTLLTLSPRIDVRLSRRDQLVEGPTSRDGEQPSGLRGGTAWSWTGKARTVFVYDSYPDDYPRAVSDPESDAAMRTALQPSGVSYRGLRKLGKHQRALALGLHFDHLPRGPLPAAFEVQLCSSEGSLPVGRTELVTEALPDGESIQGRSWYELLFDLPQPAAPNEQGLLLDLAAGPPLQLHLVFTGSRDVALAQPWLDSYWAGSMDILLPLIQPERPPRATISPR